MNSTFRNRKESIELVSQHQEKCPKLKALIVPEQHKSGAWHFHALVSNVDELTFEKAVNNQKFRKDKNGEVMLNKKESLSLINIWRILKDKLSRR